MSDRNTAAAMLGAYAVKRSLDNGTKQYQAVQALGDRIESQTEELEKQNELKAESNQIQEEIVALTHQQNHIQGLQLDQLEKQTEESRISNDIARKEARLNFIKNERKELRISTKESKEDIEARQRDCIFQIKKDSKRINSSSETKVEKFLRITNHLASINQFGISTELSNSFEDKEVIESTIADLKSNHKSIVSKLNEEEIEDIFSIMKIFQINEDRLIIDAQFNLKIITKDLRALEKKDVNLTSDKEKLKESLQNLKIQLSGHDLKEPS